MKVKLAKDSNEYFKAYSEKSLGSEKGKGKEFWEIKKLANGKIKLYSKYYKGPLFTSDNDYKLDHYMYISKDPNYKTNNRREEYTLELIKRDIPDGEYKFLSVARKGPLYSGDTVDSDGNHNLWVDKDPKFKDPAGKESWFLR